MLNPHLKSKNTFSIDFKFSWSKKMKNSHCAFKKPKADMMKPKHLSKDIIHVYGMEKTAPASAGTKAGKKNATEMVNRATESPNQAEKATNTIFSARNAQNNLNSSNTVLSEPLAARKSRSNLNCSNIEINVEAAPTAQTPVNLLKCILNLLYYTFC